MKTYFISAIVALGIIAGACGKDDDQNDGARNQRKVKYEITGNYSGKLLVVTSTNAGNLQQFNNIAVPWTRELEYGKDVLAAGIGLQTADLNVGAPGQSITLKVYLNGQLKANKTIAAGANGEMNSALAMYTF